MISRFSGIFGIILLAFGFVGGMLVDWSFSLLPVTMTLLLIGHLICGVVFLAIWFFMHGLKEFSNAEGVVKGRVTRFSAHALLYGVIFLAIVTGANFLAARHDKRLDLTEEGVFSLAPQSKRVMEQLEKPLKIVVAKTQPGKAADDLLDLIKSANPSKISTESFNPETKPHLLDAYGFKQGNSVFVSYGEGETARTSQLTQFSEQEITNAVLKLEREKTRAVYFVQGHGEGDIKSGQPTGLKALSSALEDEQFSSQPLFLSEKGSVPEDASVVIVASPKKPYLPEERAALLAYVKKGGRLILFGEPRGIFEVKDIASEFGITVNNDVVLDTVQRLFAGPALGVEPIIRTYEQHPITKDFNESTIAVLNMTSSVQVNEEKKDKDATYTEFAKTGAQAWGETNLSALFNTENPTAEKSADDISGPVSVAVAYEKKVQAGAGKEGEPASFDSVSRVVVFGSSTWVENQRFNLYANRDLILNSINWLSGEEGGVTIRPRELRSAVEPIQKNTFIFILLSGFVVPEIILVTGLFVWWRRRVVSA